MKKIIIFTSLITLSSSFSFALAKNNDFNKSPFKISYAQDQDTNSLYKKGLEEYLTFSNRGYKESINYFNKAIQLDKNFALAYAGLADSKVALSMNSNPKFNKLQTSTIELEAFENAYVATKINTNLAEAHRALSNVYYLQYRYKEALLEAKKSIELNPNDAQSHLLFWLNNIGNNNYKYTSDAAKYYNLLNLDDPVIKKAISLNPNLTSIYIELGVTAYFQNKSDKAIEYFEKVKELSPDNDDSYTFLGSIYYDMTKLDESQKNYMKALTLDENNTVANFGLGVIYSKYRNIDKATKYHKKACDLGDTDSCDWLKDKSEPADPSLADEY